MLTRLRVASARRGGADHGGKLRWGRSGRTVKKVLFIGRHLQQFSKK